MRNPRGSEPAPRNHAFGTCRTMKVVCYDKKKKEEELFRLVFLVENKIALSAESTRAYNTISARSRDLNFRELHVHMFRGDNPYTLECFATVQPLSMVEDTSVEEIIGEPSDTLVGLVCKCASLSKAL